MLFSKNYKDVKNRRSDWKRLQGKQESNMRAESRVSRENQKSKVLDCEAQSSPTLIPTERENSPIFLLAKSKNVIDNPDKTRKMSTFDFSTGITMSNSVIDSLRKQLKSHKEHIHHLTQEKIDSLRDNQSLQSQLQDLHSRVSFLTKSAETLPIKLSESSKKLELSQATIIQRNNEIKNLEEINKTNELKFEGLYKKYGYIKQKYGNIKQQNKYLVSDREKIQDILKRKNELNRLLEEKYGNTEENVIKNKLVDWESQVIKRYLELENRLLIKIEKNEISLSKITEKFGMIYKIVSEKPLNIDIQLQDPKLKNLERRCKILISDLSSKKREIDGLKSDKKISLENYSEIAGKYKSTIERLTNCENTVKNDAETVNENVRLIHECEIKDTQIRKLTDMMKNKDEMTDKYELDLENLKSESSRMIKTLTETIEKLKNDVSNLTLNLEKCFKENSSLSQIFTSLESENKSLKTANDSQNEVIYKLKEQINLNLSKILNYQYEIKILKADAFQKSKNFESLKTVKECEIAINQKISNTDMSKVLVCDHDMTGHKPKDHDLEKLMKELESYKHLSPFYVNLDDKYHIQQRSIEDLMAQNAGLKADKMFLEDEINKLKIQARRTKLLSEKSNALEAEKQFLEIKNHELTVELERSIRSSFDGEDSKFPRLIQENSEIETLKEAVLSFENEPSRINTRNGRHLKDQQDKLRLCEEKFESQETEKKTIIRHQNLSPIGSPKSEPCNIVLSIKADHTNWVLLKYSDNSYQWFIGEELCISKP